MPSTVGVVGLGIMGSVIAGSLIRAGHRVVGYDVRASRRRVLRAAGGIAVGSCRKVGQQARTVICSLPSSDALVATAEELSKSDRAAGIVIETSTLPIEVKQRAYASPSTRDRAPRLPDQRHRRAGATARRCRLR